MRGGETCLFWGVKSGWYCIVCGVLSCRWPCAATERIAVDGKSCGRRL